LKCLDDRCPDPHRTSSLGDVPPHRPPAPEPIETDEVRVVTVGTLLWGLAFLALLPFAERLSAAGAGEWPWTCATGFGLGLLGIAYCRHRRAVLRRSPARRREEETAPLREPLT
jgi:hypothetical protein